MKKSNLWVGFAYLIFGAASLAACLLIESPLESLLAGFAGAGISIGIVITSKYFYWTSPKHAQEYSERMEEEHINLNDELKNVVRGKTAQDIYRMNLVILALSMVVVSALDLLDSFPGLGILMAYLGVFFTFQLLCGPLLFKLNMKKFQ